MDWFRPRHYKHFDMPVGEDFASAVSIDFVRRHSWSPLIHYTKEVRRYDRGNRRTKVKKRDIMYASHRDSCILSKYAHEVAMRLEGIYRDSNISTNVIGYRKLGKANYHFSAEAQSFAIRTAPCVVLCFDISGFFDNLSHSRLKAGLKKLLDVPELPADWYSVLRHVTRYSYVERDDLAQHALFSDRMRSKEARLIGTIKELKANGIDFTANGARKGIPQGTPISAVLANLYLLDLDYAMARTCERLGALYQRYSDDILIVCQPENEKELTEVLFQLVSENELSISESKTDRSDFNATNNEPIQYLGFDFSYSSSSIRASSLSRQWRKLRRGVRKIKARGDLAIATGSASKVYTKKLRRRFSPIGLQNFSLYGRLSVDAFGSSKIPSQLKRLERAADRMIRELNSE